MKKNFGFKQEPKKYEERTLTFSKWKVVAHNFIAFMWIQILKLKNLDHAQKLKKHETLMLVMIYDEN